MSSDKPTQLFKRRTKKQVHYMGIAVTTELRRQLERIGEAEGRSLSGVIRVLLQEAMEQRRRSELAA